MVIRLLGYSVAGLFCCWVVLLLSCLVVGLLVLGLHRSDTIRRNLAPSGASHDTNMDLRKHALEAVTLIAAAILCALVANTVASRERKIVLVGTYPNATKVPPPAPETSTAPPMTESAAPTTTAGVPATGTVIAVPVPTSTTSAAPTMTTAPQAIPTATQPRSPVTSQPTNPATQQPATHQPSNQATRQPSNPITQPSNPPTQQPATQPPSNPPPGNAATASAKYVPHPDKPYIEIGYKDVAALHAGGALFLDARRTNVYEQGHIAGARPFSVWESDADEKVKGLWEQRQDPKEQALPIVIYCTGGDCEDSHMLAQKLWGAQFSNIYVYKDGFPDWQAKGGAVHAGATP
jgi:rhodanese-related sulfurtransferase